MGFFSGSTKVSVSTSTSRVVDDAHLPRSKLRATTRSLFKGTSLVDETLDSFLNGLAFKVGQFTRRTEKLYPRGLMKGSVASNTRTAPLVEQAIINELGRSISLEYALLAPLNYNHAAWQRLVDEYGYHRDTNTLEVLSRKHGATAYLDDFTVFLPTQAFLDAVAYGQTESFKDSPRDGYTPFRPGQAALLMSYMTQNYPSLAELWEEGKQDNPPTVEMRYIIEREGEAPKTEQLTFTLYWAQEGFEYYQAMYKDGDRYRYWTYRYGAGTHAKLDAAYSVAYVDPGKYLPVIYLRNDHVDRTAERFKDDAEYQAAEELMDLLGLDYKALGESINENPDIDKVKTAFLMFGAPLDSTSQPVMRYLFRFFDDFERRASPSQSMSSFADRWFNSLYTTSRSDYVTLNIGPADTLPNRWIGARMSLSCYTINRTVRAGRVAATGDYHLEQFTQNTDITYRSRKYDPPNEVYQTATRTRTVPMPSFQVRYQQSDASYIELEVVHPVLRHIIDNDGRSTENPANDPDFLVPLDLTLLDGFNPFDREELYAKSLHLVFNARVKKHLKWYQSGFFSFVLVVAAIALTIYTGGATWQAITAAAAISATALAMTILTIIVKAVVVNYAFKFVAEKLGPELTLYLAMAAAIYGGYSAFRTGSLTGAPWAEEALAASSGLANAANSYTQELMAGVQNDYETFLDSRQDRLATLDAANQLLEIDSLLDPMSLITRHEPVIIAGESPEAFYNRTIHAGNVGTLALDAIGSYVDNSLKLPTINDTLGDTFYG